MCCVDVASQQAQAGSQEELGSQQHAVAVACYVDKRLVLVHVNASGGVKGVVAAGMSSYCWSARSWACDDHMQHVLLQPAFVTAISTPVVASKASLLQGSKGSCIVLVSWL
jgi:hypothetical protein